MKTIHALIIDPQVDFCDPKGALYVNGAEQDMSRLAKLVRRINDKLSDIHVTLDSHHLVDIAHPRWWKDASGNHPAPFTIISLADLDSGKYYPSLPSQAKRSYEYVKALDSGSRYPLCIWPPHCLIGSVGQTVVPELFEALRNWEESRFGVVDYVTKGSNIYTEHYSAIQAEVVDPNDPTTQVNSDLIRVLMDECDEIVVAGEAGSHCLANTVRDIATQFGSDDYVKKIVLLEDCTAPVPGFEKFQTDFISEMTARGMRVTTSVDYLA